MAKKNAVAIPWLELPRRIQIVVIAAIALILNVNTLNHGFTIDDAIVITQNDFTKKGLEGIPELFKYDTFRGFFKVEGKDKLVSGGRYRPLSLVMFAVEYELFGDSPFLGHLMNILCFALLCVLIFLSLERIFSEAGMKSGPLPFLITLLFTVHPIHTEVIANIKGRDEILSMLLGTASIYFLALKNGKWFWLSAVMMFLALMAKEMAATFVPIGFLVFFVLYREKFVQSIIKCWPLLAGFVPYIAIRFAILGTGEAVYGNMEMMNNPFVKLAGGGYVVMSAGERMASIIYCLGFYLKLLLVPHPLSHDYYPRAIGIPTFNDWEVLLSVILYVGLIYIFFKTYQKKRILAFGIGYFIVSLILISNILFPIGTHMGERFLFMGSLGFCIALVRIIWKQDKNVQIRTYGLGIVMLLFAFKTVTRNPVWESDFRLFQTDIETTPNSAKLNQAAGGSLLDKCLLEGGEACDEKVLNKALGYLEKATSIHPAYRTAHLIKGNIQYVLKDYLASIQSYKAFQQYSSTKEDANSNLLRSYVAATRDIGEKGGDVKLAMQLLDAAEQIDPNHPEVLRLRGVSFGVAGRYQESIDYFKKLQTKDPGNPEVYRNIAAGYANMGRGSEAAYWFAKADSVQAAKPKTQDAGEGGNSAQ